MKNLLKISCLLVALTLVLISASACGKKNTPSKADPSAGSASSTQSVADTASTASTDSQSSTGTADTSSFGSTASGVTSSTASSTTSSTASDTVSNGTASTEVTENKPTVYLKSELHGDIVTVTAAVKNNSGLSGFSIKIGYDKDVVEAGGFDDVMKLGIASNLMQSAANCNGSVTAVYATAAGFRTDGDIFSVTFKLNDKAAASTEFKIISDKNSFVDLAVKYADFNTENVTLKLK